MSAPMVFNGAAMPIAASGTVATSVAAGTTGSVVAIIAVVLFALVLVSLLLMAHGGRKFRFGGRVNSRETARLNGALLPRKRQ